MKFPGDDGLPSRIGLVGATLQDRLSHGRGRRDGRCEGSPGSKRRCQQSKFSHCEGGAKIEYMVLGSCHNYARCVDSSVKKIN